MKPAKKAPARKPASAAPPYPGRDAFRLHRSHPAVAQLGEQLLRLGFIRCRPGVEFTERIRQGVAELQRSDPRLASEPVGHPGPLTWQAAHLRDREATVNDQEAPARRTRS